MAAASIIAVGNPGAGKSTILNSLAGENLFKSGVNIAEGLTYQLDKKSNSRGTFYDTPGLSDDTLREAAGKAITTALREGGPFKILFFIRLESGRFVEEDVTTFKLVLQSAPEIGNKFGVVTNKLSENVAKLLMNPEKASKVLTKLFMHLPEENRCAPSSVTYLMYRPEAADEDDYLLDLESLTTLEGEYFSDFVYREVETVILTKDKADDIEVQDFDKTTKIIELLVKNMREDKEMFREQMSKIIEQMEKSQKERDQQHAQDMERIHEERNKLQKLHQEQIQATQDTMRIEFERKQAELNNSREREQQERDQQHVRDMEKLYEERNTFEKLHQDQIQATQETMRIEFERKQAELNDRREREQQELNDLRERDHQEALRRVEELNRNRQREQQEQQEIRQREQQEFQRKQNELAESRAREREREAEIRERDQNELAELQAKLQRKKNKCKVM